MRVALISHTNAPWTEPYARHLLAAGHKVRIYSFHPRLIDGLDVQFIGREPFSIKHGKTLYFSRAPRVWRGLKRFAPDVVFAPYLISNGLTGALAWRGPMVVSTQGTDGVGRLCEQGFPPWAARRLIRWICKRADLVHAVSEQWRREVTDLGVPREKTFVVPLGIDTQKFQPSCAPLCNDPLHVVCIRKHEPVYRIDVILKAMASLRAKGVLFRATFAASGTLFEEHKRLAANLRIDDCVTFTGDISSDDVVELLRSADVYVSASVSDGTASSLLEAMSVGAFPVISRIDANIEWIEDGETGLFFETDSVQSTANAIERALSDPQLRVRGREANRRRVAEQADYRVTMAKLIDRLEEVGDKRSSRTR